VSVDLHHEITGDGPDLLLLHGGAGGIADLAELRELIGTGRRVIAPDQRGHGQTPDPGELSYGAMAADTAALLDKLGVRAASVVGWSDGGIIGLLLARDRPDLVSRVVAVSANASNDTEPSPFTPEAAEFLGRITPDYLPLPQGREAIDPGGAAWPATAARLIDMWRAGNDLTLDDLRGLAVPVHYLAADHDIMPLAHTVAMFEATPSAQLAILENADHRLPQTRAADVAAIITRFLEAEAPATAGWLPERPGDAATS